MSKGKKGVKKKGPSKVLERDFEVFAKGVKRLEELRAELSSLNTSGYEEDAAIIRSKLKNVSYIPEIEKEIKVLRNKIDGKHKQRSPESSNAHARIHKQINELEKELSRRKKISTQMEKE